MLEETGTVIAVDDDGVWVETLKQSACGKCAAKSGCGQQLLGKFSAGADMTFIKAFFTSTSENYAWSLGDRVRLGVDENALVLAALSAYGVPLLSMMIGIAVVSLSGFGGSDFHAVLGGAIGLISGGLIVRLHGMRSRDSSIYRAYVLDKIIAFDSERETGSTVKE